MRDDDDLQHNQNDGHYVKLVIVAEISDQREGQRQRQRLPAEGPDIRAETAPPQQRNPEQQHQTRTERRQLREEHVVTVHHFTSAKKRT